MTRNASHASRAVVVALAVAGVAATSACGPAPAPKDPASSVVAKNVTTTEGIALEMACTPTGPELCFNAKDDNCNGVIDEGCGVATGVLQFTIAWGDHPADVDLVVTDPNGVKVHKANRTASSGLQLDKNCPDDGCHGQNVENVYFEGNEPPKGKYSVDVKLVDARGGELPVKVRLSARVGNKTFSAEVPLSPGQGTEKHGVTFEL